MTKAFFVAFILCNFLVGCATYQDHVSLARQSLISVNLDLALKDLQVKANAKSDDQLVYVLDYATALQFAEKFEESNQYFLKASKLSEEKDFHSISRVAGSLLFNEEVVQYKGDSFEKAFIHVFLALNFLHMRNFDSAMVEVRKMNEKYNQARLAEKQGFEINPFSRYLAALVYEASGQWDDAFIAYKDTQKLDPNWPKIELDILRSAHLSNRSDDFIFWQKKYPDSKINVDRKLTKTHGYLKVIYLQGWGPRKVPDPFEPLVPTLNPVKSMTTQAGVIIDGIERAKTELMYDTAQAAIATLRDDRPALIARRVAARVAREAVARELGKKDDTAVAGLVSFIAMQASERADLRQWSFLPNTIQVSEVQLPKGYYEVQLQGQDDFGGNTSEVSNIKKINIRPGQTEFFIWRSVK
ncbi:MAG: hypothetical protein ACK5V3_08480 [Bdellovibrionales bacterium]